MMKRKLFVGMIVFLSCFSLLNGSFFKNKVYAEQFELSAKNVFVCDSNSQTVIYSKNENERRPIASMTKTMLLLLTFEQINQNKLNLNEEVTISENASGMGGSQVFLQANKKYKVEDLIKSIIIASANDASVAIAERLFGSEDHAVQMMNNKAKELNLNNTLFSNCTGLTKPTQYSSAKDVAIMLCELLKHELYYKYSGIFLDELTHPDGQKTTLTNTNKLVRFYEGCDGGKTGFTNEAGYCLAATAKRGNMRIISVIINEPDSKTRFAECSQLFNYAFNNFSSKMVLNKDNIYEVKAHVEKGKEEYVEIAPKDNFFVFGERNKDQKITLDFIPNKVCAPVYKGDPIGKFIIYKEGVSIGEVPAIAVTDVLKITVFDIIKSITAA